MLKLARDKDVTGSRNAADGVAFIHGRNPPLIRPALLMQGYRKAELNIMEKKNATSGHIRLRQKVARGFTVIE